MSRRSILFVGEAVTLAHVVRLLTLARGLDPADWNIAFASDPRYASVIGAHPFSIDTVWTITPERFTHAVTTGSPIYDAPSLERYVDEELRLIERYRPDVVVGDFRISLGVSARLAGVPYVNIANAYWSPYAKVRNVVPELTIARMLPLPLAQLVFQTFRRAASAFHVRCVNDLRRRRGLKTLPHDFRSAIVDSDATLYADIPEVIPTHELPASHRFIGPIPWSPSVALPDWWPEVEADAAHKPVVYVNLGSSGVPGALSRVVKALRSVPVKVIAATAGRREMPPTTGDGRIADYLPGDVCARVARVVVCNGGSPSTYQALAEGKPVIGVAANMDQFLNMAAIEDASCGRLLRALSFSDLDVRSAVMELLSNPRFREASLGARHAIGAYDTVGIFRQTLDRLTVSTSHNDGLVGTSPTLGAT